MIRGLESGLILGDSKGLWSGLNSGLHGASMTNRFNMLNPSAISDPKNKPIFYINSDNVALISGSVSSNYNLIDTISNDILAKTETVFTQSQGSSFRPPLVLNGLGGKNYMNFADTNGRYIETGIVTFPSLYASTAPSATATGLTFMFVIKRIPGGTRTIFDGRDSSSLPTAGDLLLSVDNDGKIRFIYRGGISGSVSSLEGTAGINLLNDWSILTVKCQLRIDGGALPTDSSGSPIAKRYALPTGARIGPYSAIDIFVNGIEQQKNITSGVFTNSDHYGDGTYRMLNRNVFIGNDGGSFSSSGTYIAAALMIPAYIEKSLQTRLENYFRYYYNKPF